MPLFSTFPKIRVGGIKWLYKKKVPILPRLYVNNRTVGAIRSKRRENAPPWHPPPAQENSKTSRWTCSKVTAATEPAYRATKNAKQRIMLYVFVPFGGFERNLVLNGLQILHQKSSIPDKIGETVTPTQVILSS